MSFDVDSLRDAICGPVFEEFRRGYSINCFYELNPYSVVRALRNAATDVERVGPYQSSTGADAFRNAAYISKWLADTKPIQVNFTHPINLTNEINLNTARINAAFSTYIIQCSVEEYKRLSDMMLRDLRYCFEFRSTTMPAEAIALLLKHSPDI
jgi:hypothetical protein